MHDPVLTRVSTLLAGLCAVPPSEIRPEVPLAAYGLDSVRAFELVILVEDTFGLHVPLPALETLTGATVGELAALIRQLSPHGSDTPPASLPSNP
jgi:acyl carrier protein